VQRRRRPPGGAPTTSIGYIAVPGLSAGRVGGKNFKRSLSATEQHELMPAACTGMPHAVLQRWADLRAQFSLFYITLAAPSQGHYHFNNCFRFDPSLGLHLATGCRAVVPQGISTSSFLRQTSSEYEQPTKVDSLSKKSSSGEHGEHGPCWALRCAVRSMLARGFLRLDSGILDCSSPASLASNAARRYAVIRRQDTKVSSARVLPGKLHAEAASPCMVAN